MSATINFAQDFGGSWSLAVGTYERKRRKRKIRNYKKKGFKIPF